MLLEVFYMMDFGMLFKLQGIWGKFTKNHPKFPAFLKAITSNGLKIDTIIDIKFTYPDGKTFDTNLKICEADLQAIEELKKLKK